MNFRDTASFGKRVEYKIISDMLMKGLDVYVPLVDDHGVDCVIKRKDGTFIEVQIKGRSQSAKQKGCFTVDNHAIAIDNFYFIFYVDSVDKMWVMSSKDFVNNSHCNSGGKHIGRRKVNLLTPSGAMSKKYIGFIKSDFDFINYKEEENE